VEQVLGYDSSRAQHNILLPL